MGFPGDTRVMNLPANTGDLGSTPGLRRSSGNGNPLQYSCLGNHMDRSLSSMGSQKSQINMTWQLNNNLLTERKTHNIRAPSFIQAPYCGLGFPSISDSKKSTCNVGNLDLIPGLGRSPGEGNGYPLQYSVSQPVESVVSNSLRPHGLQHAMPPYLSPTPRASSNSSPSSR